MSERTQNPLRPADDAMAAWSGHHVVAVYGAHVGRLSSVLVDPETDLRWLWVHRGRLADHHILAPAAGALDANGQLWLPLQREVLRDAPKSVAKDGYRDGSFRSESYRYYGLAGPPRRRGKLI